MNDIIEIALSQYGVKEIAGDKHNPEVLKYFDEIGHSWVDDDETAWCSAFANWIAQEADYLKSGKLNARSWLDVGIEVIDPDPGDVAIFWRGSPDSWKGHVGFYISCDEESVYVLGGNQNNMVCIKPYPKSRLLQYRDIRKKRF